MPVEGSRLEKLEPESREQTSNLSISRPLRTMNMVDTSRTFSPEQHGSEESARIVESEEKRPFTEPKLTFMTPKLVKHGDLVEVTGFFGTFSP